MISRPGQAVWSLPDQAGQHPAEFRCLPVQEPARPECERERDPGGGGARGDEEHQRQDCGEEEREEIRECEEEEQ